MNSKKANTLKSNLARLIGLVSRNRYAKKIVTVANRQNCLALSDVTGNLVSSADWTVAVASSAKVSRDRFGRTVFSYKSEKPLYIVNNGTDKEFRRLGNTSGFSTEDAKAARVSYNFSINGKLSVKIILLEFDSERRRIGEISLKNNARAFVRLRENTRYILPTIRICGEGTATLDWFKLDKVAHGITFNEAGILPVLGTGVMAETPVSSVSKGLTLAKREIDRITANIDELESKFFTEAEQKSSSRGGSEISKRRELDYRELLTSVAKTIPDSNGSALFAKLPVNVGIITDEYMYNFYRDVFENVYYLSPENYAQALSENQMDIILYVTCWKGMHGDEWKGIKYREKPSTAFTKILQYAKENGLTTIFQSIEDPSNYEYFLDFAKQFNTVFTSDIDMIDNYKADLGHSRVYYAEYGANPLINNPIGSFRLKLDKSLFAGSYPERYQERIKDMKIIFDSIGTENLTIFDRNFGSGQFPFPDRYQAAIYGPVDHETLQRIHKLFKYNLNFNSIKGSPTMCAMRVYELQALGLPIISNYANSVFNKFPEIRIIPHNEQVRLPFNRNLYLQELAAANRLMTKLHLEKNAYELSRKMITRAGYSIPESKKPTVLALCLDSTSGLKDQAESMKSSLFDLQIETLEFIQDNPAAVKEFDFIAPLSADYAYSEDYIENRLSAFAYTDSQFVTQEAVFVDDEFLNGRIHEFCHEARIPALTVAKTEIDGLVNFIQGASRTLDGAGYIADPFSVNFRDYFARNCNSAVQEKPRLSVIIPVFNNGRFLLSKCLPSLWHNNCWGQMEVLLVDDGSTDATTQKLCKTLESDFANIRYFGFEDGGSGSASRPRNKGVTLASAELVTFLDPDNEISENGYDNLLNIFDENDGVDDRLDFVSGFQVKVEKTNKITGKHANTRIHCVKHPTESFFTNGKFPVVSTQAAVIRRSMLEESGIQFVENAVGQDTLFGWEVLLNSNRTIFTNAAFLVYYAQRSDSVTNAIDISYFERSLRLEKKQVTFLKQNGLLEIYRSQQLANFVKHWYLPRLALVNPDQEVNARNILSEITAMYGRKLESFSTME